MTNGIAEALELRRKHKKDQDQREDEGDRQRITFLDELAALALEVVGVTRGENLLRLVLQEVERLAERVAGKRHALQRRRTQLLEVGERVRLRRLRDRRHRRQRHELAARRAHAILRQPIRRETEVARHLRDHLIRAAIQVEAVDVIAAEQRRERAADIRHVDAEAVRLRRIDLEFDLRRVELQVDVGENEQAALLRLLLHLVDDVGERLVIAGRADDELHRWPAGIAGERRRREREHRAAGDFGELRRQILHHRFLIARALIPRF